MLLMDSLKGTQATSRASGSMMGSSQFRDSTVLFRDFASVIGQERFNSRQFMLEIHRVSPSTSVIVNGSDAGGVPIARQTFASTTVANRIGD